MHIKRHLPLTPAPIPVSPPRSRSSKIDDRELLRRWVEGDRRSGDLLVDRYYSQLTRHFRRVVSAQEQAELTQETLTQLCVSAASALAATSNFRSYLFGIARNVLYSHLRRSYSQRNLDAVLALSQEPETSTPAAAMAVVREQAMLLELLELLPKEARMLLQAFYWDGQTANELGEALGVPPATVRTRLFHCKRRLREALDERGATVTSGDLEQQVRRLRGLMCEGPYAIARPPTH